MTGFKFQLPLATKMKRNFKSLCGSFFFHVMLYNIGTVASATSEFVGTRDTQFVLNDSTFLFNGFNSYWMMYVATHPSQRSKASEVFRDAAAAGLRVCRTWAFSEGGAQALQISPGVYNETFFQALDFVVSEAKEYEIRLILTLSNNYKDFGGRPQYVEWARSAGLSITGDDDFYTNALVKSFYQNHVQKVLTRNNTITGVQYKDDPTIMAWELINEPRCQVDYSGKMLHDWVKEMAAYVKSIDSKHLLTIGMEGFYGDSTPKEKQLNPGGYLFGTDFISNHAVMEIDFTTIHAYPDIWLLGQTEAQQMNFMHNWTTRHWEDSRNSVKKPLVFSEFGKSKNDTGYSTDRRDKFLESVYSSIYNLARDGGTIAGGLLWQIMATGMEQFYDGYEILLSQEPSTHSVIAQQSYRMNSLQNIQRSNSSSTLY